MLDVSMWLMVVVGVGLSGGKAYDRLACVRLSTIHYYRYTTLNKKMSTRYDQNLHVAHAREVVSICSTRYPTSLGKAYHCFYLLSKCSNIFVSLISALLTHFSLSLLIHLSNTLTDVSGSNVVPRPRSQLMRHDVDQLETQQHQAFASIPTNLFRM